MIKRLTYKTFSGLADLQDFKDSGGMVSHRTEAGVRRLARINALREKLAALEKARRPGPHYKIWRVPAHAKKGGPNKARPICMAIVAREVDADILVDLYNNSYNDVCYYTPEAMNETDW